MNETLPPRPEPLKKRAGPIRRLREGLRSGLSMFLGGSYADGGVGRHRIPTLRFKHRWLFNVREPDLIREVLVKRADEFPKSELMDDMLRALTGYSIFVSNGEVWRRQRRMMDPALEGARIRDVFPMMQTAAEACLARFEAQAGTASASAPPAPVDLEMTHFAADVIFRTIYSEPVTADAAKTIFSEFNVFQDVAYAHGMLRLTRFPTNLLPSARRAKRAARLIRAELKAPLDRRVAAMQAGKSAPSRDILSTLMTVVDPVTQTRFDEGELLDQIAMLFLAGHETSASGLAWALYLLATHPHYQERLHEEAVAILGARTPEWADMKQLSFTRDVFREALRLYPPVAFVARDATCPERMANRDIETDSVLLVSPWIMHRHEKHWENPHAFDPDRFNTEAGRAGMRCAYLPFSMGPRVCPGAAFALQEATLVLSQLCRRFRFLPAPGHTPDPVARLTLRSANGIPLIIERR